MLKVKKGKEKEKKKADKNSQSVDTMLIDGAHAPIYPLIANQIISKLHITEGVAIDVGTGPASLSVAMARLSDLKIYAMDISAEVIQIAQESMEKKALKTGLNLCTVMFIRCHSPMILRIWYLAGGPCSSGKTFPPPFARYTVY
jgi:predicted RNA methylase